MIALLFSRRGISWNMSPEYVGIHLKTNSCWQGQSLEVDSSVSVSEELAQEQEAHDTRAARQWVPHINADDEEMNRL